MSGGRLAGIVAIGILVVVVIVVSNRGSKPVTAAAVTQQVGGDFVRTGCLGCSSAISQIIPSDVFCGWDGKNVVIHVTFQETSSQSLTVTWHPSYLIENGTPHGTSIASIQSTKLEPGKTVDVFATQSPQGTPVGTPIERCYPSFAGVG